MFRAEEYIEGVMGGKIVVCKWVRLAVERHLRDLESGGGRGLWFDVRAAKLVIAWFSLLKHSKGEWAGRTISLEPWQQFVLWVLFGWKRADGTRRFRTSYQEVARKNGKTTIQAGMGLFLLLADGEPGAEVYTAATKRDQARLTHGEATRMVKSSAKLRKEVTVYKDNLHVEGTASKYEPLGADEQTLDGLNVHAALADEVHAWKDGGLWDVLETATGARRQPLMSAITTAGYDRQTICFQLHEYTERILSGLVEDDTFFGIIFTLDEGDDWEDERNWIKANPNLGVSKKLDDLRQKAARAREMPSRLNAFLRLEMNMWTQAETRWMSVENWQACGFPVNAEGLRGRVCYAGLDLSSKIDITALVHVFPPESEGDKYQVACRFWVPEDRIMERVKKDMIPYDVWVRQGWIMTTPGNVIDYEFILAQLGEDADAFDVQEVAFDRWGAAQVSTRMQDMLGEEKVIEFGQGYASMSGPTKELEALVLQRMIAHGGNPVLAWMMDNVVVRTDPAGNLKPDKERSKEKIDGVVALIMGLDRALRHQGGSVYEERGLREI